MDILLISGMYPDFEDQTMKKADIGLKDGRIVFVGKADEAMKKDAKRVIDCSGRVVSPGFIDIHMHEESVAEGDKWVIAEMMLKQGVTLAVGGNCGVMRQPVRDFKAMIERLGGCPINYALLTGYNYYRHDVLGFGHYQDTDKESRDKIREYMRQDIEDGAFGISFGLEYDQSISFEEMLYATECSEDKDLLVAAHYRTDNIINIDSIYEMIRFQKAIDKRFQISHLSSCSAYGCMEEVLELINEAMEKDPRLNYDTYPYDAFSTNIGTTVFKDGCLDVWKIGYDRILLTDEPYKNVFCTKEIFEDARANYPEIPAVVFLMRENEIAMAIGNKYGMVASDGIIANGNGHPRCAGTFPRVLGKYVREEKILSLIDALKKMTIEPAKRLLMDKDRGSIKEGKLADITVFDPDTIIDGPVYGDINVPNKGIDFVIVNGEVAFEDGEIKSKTAGSFVGMNK